MNRIVRLLISLYPQTWRERYGVEFAALLEELPCRWTDLTDILCGAITMNLRLRSWEAPSAYVLLALALAWVSSRAAVCTAAVRVAEWVFPLLGTPVVREAGMLLLPAHQQSGLSLWQGAFCFATLSLGAISCWLFSRRRFTEQALLLAALLPSALLGYSTRIVISGLLAEANQSGALIAVVGSASFLLAAAFSFSGFLVALSVASRVVAVVRRRRALP
ncbi:MAG: hypothetical protein JNK48_32335 [Bryobacterales bacterium]|nr:hypothetical protein [Bryobacterales bacterium]